MNEDKTRCLSPSPAHISVCICTFKRAELLADLLNELNKQITENLFDFSIVVVDNDSNGSARSVVSSAMNESPVRMEYDIEPVQNISLARNRAVLNARGDFIAFIDDDEIPDRHWLLDLYQALRSFNVDGVLGPVLPYYKIEPPNWVIKARFYERPTYRTGFVIDWRKGRTGNILLKKSMFLSTGEMFDPKFGSGAEDQDFVRRMIQKGFVFIWCNEARAYELVPPIRWNKKFMIKRALLRGKTSLARTSSPLYMVIQSAVAILAYTMALPLLLLFGYHWFMQYLVKDFDHIGKILAILRINIIKQKYITE